MNAFDMTPFFFGPTERRLYGVYHPPAPAQRTAQQVLLCPPFGQEAVRVQLLHRLLADQLARQGIHVMRFNYHGTGESAGADADATLTGWCDDILTAHDELSRRTRAHSTTWLGSRLGGTLAMMASSMGKGTPERIVLWEPILDGPRYLHELGKAHAQHSFSPFIHAQRPAEQVKDEVLGFAVSETWIRQLQAVGAAQLNPTCAEVCVHIASQEGADTLGLAKRLQARGVAWQHLNTPTRIDWFQEEARGSTVAPPELLRLLAFAATGAAA